MNAVVAQIMELSGEMPDPDRFRNYLRGLSEAALRDRLVSLRAQGRRSIDQDMAQAQAYRQMMGGGHRVKAEGQGDFWSRAVKLAKADVVAL